MLDRRLETAILREADAVVANTDANRSALLKDCGLPDAKVHVIPNGFDPADFPPETANDHGEGFVVACMGKFYRMPDVAAFFNAFRRLASVRPGARLAIHGPLPRAVHRAMAEILPTDLWHWTQRVDHSAAVRIMRSAAVLLANVPGERSGHWVPGKLYEYVAAARPILFIGPEDGEAAKIIASTRTGTVVPNEADRIFERLLSLHSAWSVGFPDWRPDRGAIAAFDRRRQTAQLASIFDSLPGTTGGSRVHSPGPIE
jgi:glycosyltransferase involved in cell wall biosynthesis